MSSSPLSPRAAAAAVWTGSELIIWGGASAGLSTGLNDGARYNPLTNSWTILPGTGAPSARFHAASAWTGRTMVVWGGESAGTPTGTGSAYDPALNTWTALPVGLTPRSSAGSAWSGDVLFMFGGTLTGGGFTQELQAWVGAQSLVP